MENPDDSQDNVKFRGLEFRKGNWDGGITATGVISVEILVEDTGVDLDLQWEH